MKMTHRGMWAYPQDVGEGGRRFRYGSNGPPCWEAVSPKNYGKRVLRWAESGVCLEKELSLDRWMEWFWEGVQVTQLGMRPTGSIHKLGKHTCWDFLAYGSMQRVRQSLHGSARGPLHIYYGWWLGVFVGLLTVEMGVPLTLLSALGTLFLLLACFTQLWYESLCLVLLYLVLLCSVGIPERPGLLFFGGGDREGMDWGDGEECVCVVGVTGRSWWRANCSWGCIVWENIKFKKKQAK